MAWFAGQVAVAAVAVAVGLPLLRAGASDAAPLPLLRGRGRRLEPFLAYLDAVDEWLEAAAQLSRRLAAGSGAVDGPAARAADWADRAEELADRIEQSAGP